MEQNCNKAFVSILGCDFSCLESDTCE